MRILPIGDEPALLDYSRAILNELRAHQVRAEIDESTDKINGKIQRAEQMKVHTMLVIGKRDMEANAVSVRVHGKGNLGAKPRGDVTAQILEQIRTRAAWFLGTRATAETDVQRLKVCKPAKQKQFAKDKPSWPIR